VKKPRSGLNMVPAAVSFVLFRRGAEVGVAAELVHVRPLRLVRLQAPLQKALGLRRHLGLLRKHRLGGAQHGVFAQKLLLGQPLAVGAAAVQHLVVNYSQAPHVHFGRDARAAAGLVDPKALRWQVPDAHQTTACTLSLRDAR